MSNETKPLRVRILDKEYALRVREEDVENTIEMATYLDTKMRAFRNAHPDQSEVTTAVIAALAITEELILERQRHKGLENKIDSQLTLMTAELEEALTAEVADSVPAQAQAKVTRNVEAV